MVLGGMEVQFNADWAMVFWGTALLTPYALWQNPESSILLKAYALMAPMAVVGVLLQLDANTDITDAILLQNVSRVGRFISFVYVLIFVATFTFLGKLVRNIVGLTRRTDHGT